MYEHMGATEFDDGNRSKSLIRIFTRRMCREEVKINVGGQEIVVYVFAAANFSRAECRETLELLTHENSIIRGLKKPTFFDLAVAAHLGGTARYTKETVVWFDIANDFLWTITQENADKLAAALEEIEEAFTMTPS